HPRLEQGVDGRGALAAVRVVGAADPTDVRQGRGGELRSATEIAGGEDRGEVRDGVRVGPGRRPEFGARRAPEVGARTLRAADMVRTEGFTAFQAALACELRRRESRLARVIGGADEVEAFRVAAVAIVAALHEVQRLRAAGEERHDAEAAAGEDGARTRHGVRAGAGVRLRSETRVKVSPAIATTPPAMKR